MALPSSGAISLNDIATEFGGAQPHNLSEYYRGGANVLDKPGTASIPTSGGISLSQFYGTYAPTEVWAQDNNTTAGWAWGRSGDWAGGSLTANGSYLQSFTGDWTYDYSEAYVWHYTDIGLAGIGVAPGDSIDVYMWHQVVGCAGYPAARSEYRLYHSPNGSSFTYFSGFPIIYDPPNETTTYTRTDTLLIPTGASVIRIQYVGMAYGNFPNSNQCTTTYIRTADMTITKV